MEKLKIFLNEDNLCDSTCPYAYSGEFEHVHKIGDAFCIDCCKYNRTVKFELKSGATILCGFKEAWKKKLNNNKDNNPDITIERVKGWIKEEDKSLFSVHWAAILVKFIDCGNGITASTGETVDISWIRDRDEIVCTSGRYKREDIREWKVI